jgi:hypothetical protein
MERVRIVVRSDRGDIGRGRKIRSVRNILHKDLNIHYFCQHLVPKMPFPEHKETRMSLAGDLITAADKDVDCLNSVITVKN